MSDPPPAAPPAWFTPARLLAIFCAVNTLLYLDRGLFASNGVNGAPRSAEAPRGAGIQVRSERRRALFQNVPILLSYPLCLAPPFPTSARLNPSSQKQPTQKTTQNRATLT